MPCLAAGSSRVGLATRMHSLPWDYTGKYSPNLGATSLFTASKGSPIAIRPANDSQGTVVELFGGHAGRVGDVNLPKSSQRMGNETVMKRASMGGPSWFPRYIRHYPDLHDYHVESCRSRRSKSKVGWSRQERPWSRCQAATTDVRSVNHKASIRKFKIASQLPGICSSRAANVGSRCHFAVPLGPWEYCA